MATSEYFMNHGTWPAKNSDAGLQDKGDIIGKYVTQVDVSTADDKGVITVTYGG